LLQEKVVLDRICLAIDINREKVLHAEMVWSNVVEPFKQCPEPRVVYVRIGTKPEKIFGGLNKSLIAT
jgi:hypothetical protein